MSAMRIRQRGWRKFGCATAALTGLTLLMLGAVTAVVWLTVHPVRFRLRNTPARDHLAYERISFRSRDGITLAGWWVPAASPNATIILCHGFPSDRRDVLPMIPFLHKAGYNVLAFDFRRLGESGGTMSTAGLQEPRDLLGAVDYAAGRSDRPIAVLGVSMGAAACLMAAASEPRIGAVIADSPYAALNVQTVRRFGHGPVSEAMGRYAAWLGERLVKEPLSDASPLHAVRLLAARPLLLIHSAHDSIIPDGDSRAIYAAATGPKDLWITRASGHVRSFHDCRTEYERRVLLFLKQWLNGRRRAGSQTRVTR